MISKDFWKSKIFWQNTIVAISGICMLAASTLTQTPVLTIPGWFSLAAGICGVILRVYFTDTKIIH